MTAERLVFAVLLATVPLACATQQVRTPRTIATSARMPRRRDEDWTVETLFAGLDSLLLAGIDTATTEGGWCLELERNDSAGVLRIMSVVPPTSTEYSHADSTRFECPPGGIPAHRHFLDRSHDNGPSAHDRATARRLRLPGVVVVVSPDRRSARYVPYGVPEN